MYLNSKQKSAFKIKQNFAFNIKTKNKYLKSKQIMYI